MITLQVTLLGVLAILAGLLVLFWPKILRYAVGIYLILVGVLRFIEF
jgi:uncharacterized membrane protein HdeD (DUF308 family)